MNRNLQYDTPSMQMEVGSIAGDTTLQGTLLGALPLADSSFQNLQDSNDVITPCRLDVAGPGEDASESELQEWLESQAMVVTSTATGTVTVIPRPFIGPRPNDR